MHTHKPFTTTALNLWLDLIEQAVRLRNPKVIDLGPLKRAAKDARNATYPRMYQTFGRNSFMDMILAAEALPRGDNLRREGLIDLACQCLATLINSEIRHADKDHLVMLAGKDFATFRQLANRCVSTDAVLELREA